MFLLYINDLNQAIKLCKIHHFADDTNLSYLSNSIEKLNKRVNADLKQLVNWLNASKISLNIKKTEMVIFKSKQKKFEADLKVRLCGERLYPKEGVKHLGVKIYANINWQCQVDYLSVKLNRVNALLFKIKKYVSPKILRFICFAFSNPTYLIAFLSGLRILDLFNNLWFYKKKLLELLISNQGISILVPYLNKVLF